MTNILDAYRFHRQGPLRFQPNGSLKALQLARADVEAGKKRYPSSDTRKPMRAGITFMAYGSECFWCEYPGDYTRPLGFADEVARLDHRGWFLDEFQDEVARGVVYQLPAAPDGSERFLYGVADPCNDGPALLSLDIATDKHDAARWADDMAERYAEREREYREAGNARIRFDDLGDAIASKRRDALKVLEARRELRADEPHKATLLEVLECKAWELIEDIREARKERQKLADSFDHLAGWEV